MAYQDQEEIEFRQEVNKDPSIIYGCSLSYQMIDISIV